MRVRMGCFVGLLISRRFRSGPDPAVGGKFRCVAPFRAKLATTPIFARASKCPIAPSVHERSGVSNFDVDVYSHGLLLWAIY